MSTRVVNALEQFVQRYLNTADAHPEMLLIEYDAQWPSDCYSTAENTQGLVNWSPVRWSEVADFKDLENALDMVIHPDIVSFYTTYWSDNLNAQTSKGCLQLLQPWNQNDFDQLQQNLVGHVLMKRRLKQPETLFFALTDEDDFILTIDNKSGEVLLEQVGLLPKETVAANLATFIQSLQPSPTAM